jgi:hypothetical protein
MTKQKRKSNRDRPRVVINGQALNARQERVWRAANDDVDSGDYPRLRRGLAALATLEGELVNDRVIALVREGLAETVALERMRGEKVDVVSAEAGRRRVHIQSRDGLETLRRTGAISARQHHAGLLYRELYEGADPERDLKSQMSKLDRGGGSVSPQGLPEAWAERRLRLSGRLSQIEARVRETERGSYGVRALREVAGHARCISHFVRGGGAQARYRDALLCALDLCADHFRLT